MHDASLVHDLATSIEAASAAYASSTERGKHAATISTALDEARTLLLFAGALLNQDATNCD